MRAWPGACGAREHESEAGAMQQEKDAGVLSGPDGRRTAAPLQAGAEGARGLAMSADVS